MKKKRSKKHSETSKEIDTPKVKEPAVKYQKKANTMYISSSKPPSAQNIRLVDDQGKTTMVVEGEAGIASFIEPFRGLQSELEIHEAIDESEIKFKEINPILSFYSLSNAEKAKALGVSLSTFDRYTPKTKLSKNVLFNAYKIDQLTVKGIEVFGSKNAFEEWLDDENLALGDKKPKEYLSNPAGVELLEEALEALEWGNIM